MTLHVTRTDTLLWVLGGFAAPPIEMSHGTAMPLAYVRELRKLVERGGRLRYGEAVSLGARFGRPPSSIRTLLSTYRTARSNGRQMPAYWRDAA